MAKRKFIWIPYKESYCVSLDVKSQRITHVFFVVSCGTYSQSLPLSEDTWVGPSQSCVLIKRIFPWNIQEHWKSVWTFVQSQRKFLGLLRFPQWFIKILQVLLHFFLIYFYFIFSIYVTYINDWSFLNVCHKCNNVSGRHICLEHQHVKNPFDIKVKRMMGYSLLDFFKQRLNSHQPGFL